MQSHMGLTPYVLKYHRSSQMMVSKEGWEGEERKGERGYNLTEAWRGGELSVGDREQKCRKEWG